MGGLARPILIEAARSARASVAVGRLAITRIARRAGSTLAIGGAVAVAILGVFAVGPISLIGEDAAIERSLDALSTAGRSVRVELLRFGDPGTGRMRGLPARDARAVEQALALLPPALAPGPTHRTIAFAAGAAGGANALLTGVDDPGRLRAVDGRLPGPCRPARCEAVVLGRARVPAELELRGLRLRIVGRARPDAELRTAVAAVSGGAAQAPVLVVAGIAPLDGAPGLQFAARRYFWSRAVAPTSVHPWNVGALFADLSHLSATLGPDGLLTELGSPAPRLRALQARAHAARQRLLVIAAIAAAALLAFAALGGVVRQADVSAELSRLVDGGARRHHQLLFVALEPLLLATAGLLVGGAAALGVTLAAGELRLGDGALLLRSAPLSSSLPVALGVWLAATVLLATAHASGRDRDRRRWTLELVTGTALALVLWQAGQRGALDARALDAADGAIPEILVLPGLLALATALVATRLAPPLLRAIERRVPARAIDARLALLGLTRNPGRTAVVAGFVAAGVALGLFALSYATQLTANLRDHATLAAGADLRVREESAASPAADDVLPLDRWRHVGAAAALPAVRADAEIAADGISGGPLTLLALPARGLGQLAAMRLALGEDGARALGRTLQPGSGLLLAGPALPAGARELRLPLRLRGAAVRLLLPLQRSDGHVERIALGELDPGSYALRAALPRDVAGARVLGLELALVGGSASASRGLLELGPLSAQLRDGRVRTVTDFRGRDWVEGGGAETELPPRGGVLLRFPTAGDAGLPALRADQPGADQALPAVVSPAIARAVARAGGALPLRLPSGQIVQVTAARTVRALPTAGARFALVDVARLASAVGAQAPGALVPGEMWLRLRAPGDEARVRARLGAARFRPTSVVSRARLERAGEQDPFSRVAIAGLRLAALLALLIAVCGVALGIRTTLRDAAAELVDLEAVGVPPRSLRRQLRGSTALLALLGALVGVGGALAMSAAFTSIVHVGADARDAFPALPAGLAWPAAGGGLLASALLGAGAVLAITRAALRGPTAGRLDV